MKPQRSSWRFKRLVLSGFTAMVCACSTEPLFLTSSPGTVTIIVNLPIRFSVEPRDGSAPLTVVASALTHDGSPLPDGTYSWSFGGQTVAGPVDTHAMRTFSFTNPGVYAVTLSVTLAGATAPISCRSENSGTNTEQVVARPTVSGHVRDADGHGLAGAVVAANNGGSTAVTDANGYYVVNVPYNWSGEVTPQQAGTAFAPTSLSETGVTKNRANRDFAVAPMQGGQPPEVVQPLADLTVNEDAADTALDLSTVFADPDPGDVLTFSVASNDNPTLVNATITGSLLTLSNQPDQNGVADVTVRATDPAGAFVEDDLAATVNAVNDAPSFTAPPNQLALVGSPVTIDLSPVSAGPTDEAGQLVTLNATSGNESVVPNANLAVSGSQLTLTAVAQGQTTITVVAADDGGTANGGDDTGDPASFAVTGVTGATITGTFSLTPTVGARPNVGHVPLLLEGSNGSPNFNVTTEVDGTYLATVSDGWTGVIKSGDLSKCLVFGELEITTPVTTGSPVTGANLAGWVPPIGIPMPPFGIAESHMMYADATFDFGSGPVPYPDAGNGPYTHYVDRSDPNATDSGNPFGSPSQPRRTIPYVLPAGAVVELHGTYDANHSSPHKIDGAGSAAQPIFIRGTNASSQPHVTKAWEIRGSYMVLEHLRFADDDGDLSGGDMGDPTVLSPAHHVSLRHCDISGDLTDGGLGLASWDGQTAHNLVVYDDVIHDNGDWQATFDQDRHGIAVGDKVNTSWVLDNEMYHNSGDGIQINGNATTHHIYVGRNTMWQNKQTGFWCKTAYDVVFSQNTAYGHRPSDSSPGAGCGWQYDGQRIWFLYNHLYDNTLGIRGASGNQGGCDEIYIIGNLIHDMDDSWAIEIWSNDPTVHIVNNTIFNTDGGISAEHATAYHLANNLISNVRGGYHVDLYGLVANQSTMTNCLFHEPNGSMRVRWDSTTYTTVAALNSATGAGANCVAADPEFVNAENGDFHVQAASPAANSGIEDAAFDQFQALYGLSIQLDFECISRPQGGEFDMGAFER